MKRRFLFLICIFSTWSLNADSLQGTPPPEKKEYRFHEIESQRYDLDGKVILASINAVGSLKQVESLWYAAACGYHTGSAITGTSLVLVPEPAKKFFEMMVSQPPGGTRKVYLKIYGKNPKKLGGHGFYYEAIGSRYSTSKNKYEWR